MNDLERVRGGKRRGAHLLVALLAAAVQLEPRSLLHLHHLHLRLVPVELDPADPVRGLLPLLGGEDFVAEGVELDPRPPAETGPQ